jgi:hypothetical protein
MGAKSVHSHVPSFRGSLCRLCVALLLDVSVPSVVCAVPVPRVSCAAHRGWQNIYLFAPECASPRARLEHAASAAAAKRPRSSSSGEQQGHLWPRGASGSGAGAAAGAAPGRGDGDASRRASRWRQPRSSSADGASRGGGGGGAVGTGRGEGVEEGFQAELRIARCSFSVLRVCSLLQQPTRGLLPSAFASSGCLPSP